MARGDSPRSSPVVYVPSELEGTRVHWPLVCVSARVRERESVCARLGTKKKKGLARRKRGRLREGKKEKAKKEGRRSREREKGDKRENLARALFCRVITMERRRYLKMKYRPCVCVCVYASRVISMRISESRRSESSATKIGSVTLRRRNRVMRRADLIM